MGITRALRSALHAGMRCGMHISHRALHAHIVKPFAFAFTHTHTHARTLLAWRFTRFAWSGATIRPKTLPFQAPISQSLTTWFSASWRQQCTKQPASPCLEAAMCGTSRESMSSKHALVWRDSTRQRTKCLKSFS